MALREGQGTQKTTRRIVTHLAYHGGMWEKGQNMSEFTAITTQEEFDARIRERLKQKDEAAAKKYEGYMSAAEVEQLKAGYDKQISDLTRSIEGYSKEKESWEKALAEKDTAIKAYESHSVKTRIANELGLPYDAIDFIKGEGEDDIRKSAETLKALTGNRTMPLANPEPGVKGADPKTAAWQSMAKTLNQ